MYTLKQALEFQWHAAWSLKSLKVPFKHNINKKVFHLVNEAVKARCFGKSLIDTGTCNIHIMHNAFMKGIQVHGQVMSDVIIKIYYFFDGWPTHNTKLCRSSLSRWVYHCMPSSNMSFALAHSAVSGRGNN